MDWNNLPQELVDSIASKVFAIDRHNFSLVFRSWNTAVATSPFRHSACLMFNHRSNCSWKLFQHNSFFHMDFPEKIKSARILFSNHGWLLMMCPDDENLFFFHPFNNQIIELPPPLEESDYTTICFFHPPTSPDCFIFGINAELRRGKVANVVKIGNLKYGEHRWSSHDSSSKKYGGFNLCIGPPVLCDGFIYFLDIRGNLAYFDINESLWMVFLKCFKQRRRDRNIKEHFLIKPKGGRTIFSVFVVHDESKVRVFKLMLGISWKLVEDLGDMVFYVSNTSSFGYRTDDKSLANKIFFIKYQDDKIVYYSLKTQKYHSSEGNYSSNDAYDLKRFDFATWTIPAHNSQQVLSEFTWCLQVDETAT